MLKPGDLVRVVKAVNMTPSPAILGRKGKIIFVENRGKWADVILDGDQTPTAIRIRLLSPLTVLDLLSEI